MKETQEKWQRKRMIQKSKVENLQRNVKNQGITLIALVATIVILLILSGVTINMLLGENGIIRTAQEAKNTWEEATANEEGGIQNLVNELNNIMNREEKEPEPEDIETVTDTNHDTLEVKDEFGNIVTIPKGFKVVISEGITVPEGIVIEDANGNQFVWIPVGIVHKDNNPENDVTIKLGRYTFDETNGTPTMQQAAFAGDNPNNVEQTYVDEVTISFGGGDYKELTTYRAGIASNGTDGLNATAKDLAGFMQSVKDNGGYYLARYEASYGSGYNSEGTTDEEKYANAKPLSKVSIGNSIYETRYDESGQLWTALPQLQKSKVSQNMYANDNSVGVESDLTNSYAWDTAIVFIQSMDETKSNYAIKKDLNGTLKNTGETGDKACNIFDIAANITELTTEYSLHSSSEHAFPCTNRGGSFNLSSYTAYRGPDSAINSSSSAGLGFRVTIYVK